MPRVRSDSAAALADCDRALELLRLACRVGSVEERAAARLSVDRVLDRRLVIVRRRRAR
jgi:hypothetical protein